MSSEFHTCRLDDIAQLNPKRSVRKGSSVPFIDMAALPQHGRDISCTSVDIRIAKGSGAHFQNGDTLLARITPCLENGKTAQVRCLDGEQIGEGSTEFIVLSGVNPSDNDYIYYLCRDPSFREFAISRMEGTSGRQRVSWQSIAAYEFNCPNVAERRAAAQFLVEIDDRITLLRETNTTLEAIAQALFKSWFIDFDPVRAKMEGRAPEGMDEATAALFPDSFEESELGLVPKGWRVGTLADVASYQNGYAFKTKDWSGVGHPVIKIGNVKPGIIETTGASYVLPETIVGLDRFRLQRGDLLVGMTGYVGETGLVPEIEPAAYLNQRVGKISTESGISDLGFVYCIVRNPAYKTHAESKSHGSAQANVSGTDLMSYPTVLPSTVVLDVFNQILAVFIWQILVNYEESQSLAALRDTLLPRLISGQLDLTPNG